MHAKKVTVILAPLILWKRGEMYYCKDTKKNELEDKMCHASKKQLSCLHSDTVQVKRE